ncbi:MAG: hypothetical protein NC901_03195 [Candidatus Omnitrophica bacterium]|nr:hypothetical protein [Candidatus Omnitrophota bacterium]
MNKIYYINIMSESDIKNKTTSILSSLKNLYKLSKNVVYRISKIDIYKPIKQEIVEAWRRNVIVMFNNQGKIGTFQKWAPLNPKWLRRKKRLGYRTEILRCRNDGIYNGLMEPLVDINLGQNGKYNIISLKFTKLPSYAIYHQHQFIGRKHQPRRTFLRYGMDFYNTLKNITQKIAINVIKTFIETEIKDDIK